MTLTKSQKLVVFTCTQKDLTFHGNQIGIRQIYDHWPIEITNAQTHQKHMKLLMENPNTGIIKKAPVGFSWTTLFFSGFPSLFRGDIKWFIVQVLLCWTGISFIIFAFIYNKIYIKKLLEKGFKVKDVEGGTLEDAKTKLGINLPKFGTQTN
jgi:hypothetical protein